MNQNLSKGFIRCAVNTMQELFTAPEDDLKKFVDANAKSFLSFSHFYDHITEDDNISGLDTQDRDILYDVIGLYFCRARWPRYMDSNYDEFITTLKQHTKDYGWKLNSF